MYPITHLIISLILVGILYPLVGPISLWILVGGFLIDFDHIIYYTIRFKKFSLRKAYNYHDERHKDAGYEKDLLHIFHTLEFWIIMIIASLYFKFILFILTGMILHIALDFIDLMKRKVLDARAISLIKWLKRRNFL